MGVRHRSCRTRVRLWRGLRLRLRSIGRRVVVVTGLDCVDALMGGTKGEALDGCTSRSA